MPINIIIINMNNHMSMTMSTLFINYSKLILRVSLAQGLSL